MAQTPKQNSKAVAQFNGVAALMAAAGHQCEDFVYGDIRIPMRAVTIQQMLRLCRRFPSLLKIFEGDDLMKAVIEAGDEAVASLIAFSCNEEGNAEFEGWLLSAPDDVVLDLVEFALKMTFRGESPDVFFLKLLQRLETLGLVATSQAAA